MKKIILYGVTLSLSVSLMACAVKEKNHSLVEEAEIKIEEQIDKDQIDKEEIRKLVEDFGKKLQEVSVLAPKDILEKSMEENYGDLVSEDLMEKWLSDLEDVPGRLTSSPWPDSIKIENIEKLLDNEYKVEGKVIEITSNEDDKEISRPARVKVIKVDDKWLINDVYLGEYE